ncbi:TIR domain-containing protein [Tessaracoccus defluvii]|uniref:Nucleoside 2-deoxyribosyltransferase n=1 Tax=Tessaracoccus defluvii TaxID=1285901 RepID=A0A7H0H4R6_9ACTN|nr:hypothetical protein [Tessaracoccus defluvii]QNP55532.1 hypothetical protein H9L22_15310 [Tessaracoccus defluvii]
MIAITRHADFSPLETALLDLWAGEVALEIQAKLNRRYTTQIRSALSRPAPRNGQPGTVFANLTSLLTRAFGVRFGAYFSSCGSTARLEYLTARRRPYNQAHWVTDAGFIELLTSFVKMLQAGAPFFWRQPSSVFDKSTLDHLDVHSVDIRALLVIPINSGTIHLGFWCLFFINEPEVPEEVFDDLVFSDLAIRQASWLMQRRFRAMLVEPIYASRETRVTVGRCAVLMPFMMPWSDRIWSRCIRPYVELLGFDAMRADDLYGRDVMEDIWSMILSAEVVVADITGRNANVFYELGLAHAIGKPVILLTQQTADIPFDLNRYRHVIYEDNADGYETLQKGLSGALGEVLRARNPKDS